MNVRQADHIQMSLPAKPEYVGVVRLTISGIANRLSFTYDEIEDIKIALAEACTNVIVHAYEGEKGMINLSFYVHADRLEMVVSDSGRSFDIEKTFDHLKPVNPDQPIAELKEGGLGLFLIQSLMDKVEVHHDRGVVLKMTKYLQRDEVKSGAERISSEQWQQQADLRMD